MADPVVLGDDLLLINRGGADYQASRDEVRSPVCDRPVLGTTADPAVQEDDLFLVNRGSVDYSATKAELVPSVCELEELPGRPAIGQIWSTFAYNYAYIEAVDPDQEWIYFKEVEAVSATNNIEAIRALRIGQEIYIQIGTQKYSDMYLAAVEDSVMGSDPGARIKVAEKDGSILNTDRYFKGTGPNGVVGENRVSLYDSWQQPFRKDSKPSSPTP